MTSRCRRRRAPTSVARVKRDIRRRSSVGMMVTNRSNSTVVPGASNFAYGADASFSFFQNVSFGGYYSGSRTSTERTTTRATRDASTTPPIDTASSCSSRCRRELQPRDRFVRRYGFDRTHARRVSFASAQALQGNQTVHPSGESGCIQNSAGRLRDAQPDGPVSPSNARTATSSSSKVAIKLRTAGRTVCGAAGAFPAGVYPFNDVTFAINWDSSAA